MQLLTQKEAAALLSVSIKTVSRYRQSGLLPTISFNKRTIRIPKLAVEKFIEGSRCQNHQGYNKGTNTGTSPTLKTAEVNEIAYGRQIYRSQRLGFKAG